MNRSINPLPDVKVLRRAHFGSKVISFAAVVFPRTQAAPMGRQREMEAGEEATGPTHRLWRCQSTLSIQETLVQGKHQTQAQVYHQR